MLNNKIFNLLFLLYLPSITMAENISCIANIDINRINTPIERNLENINSDLNELQIIVGAIDLSSPEKIELFDRVEFRYGDKILSATEAAYDDENKRVEATGSVDYEDSNIHVYGEIAEIDTNTEEINFFNSGFELINGSARARANNIKIASDETITLSGTDFTTCPENEDDWNINASNINLNISQGFGDARNITLNFRGIPILYSPYFNFPISNKRKSGILIPKFSERDKTGTDISIPYYFNIAQNYDLTLEPRIMSKRGLQINNEFRYLTKFGEGILDFEYLAKDKITKKQRGSFNFTHSSILGENWYLTADIANISDDMYFEDLSNNQNIASQTHLKRNIGIKYNSKNWFFSTNFQNYQTINPSISYSDRPYDYKPQVLLNGYWEKNKFSLQSKNEVVNFAKDGNPIGWRINSNQEIGVLLDKNGIYFNPKIAIDHTDYRLKNIANKKHSRTIPISSINIGVNLNRSIYKEKYYQTLEPKILLTHIPYIDQSNFPIFDTIIPDYNLIQLFRNRQHLGIDKIANTKHLSFGITSRIIQSKSGKERITATIGQTQYYEDQKVGLPGEPLNKKGDSDLISQLSLYMDNNWRMNLGYSKGSKHKKNEKIEASIQYSPKNNQLLKFSYRSRQELLEQVDIAAVWPIKKQWNFIGLYSYSFFEKKSLDQFFGLEYESCCWRTRLVGRKYISRRNGEFDSSISIQFQLKGITDNVNSSLDMVNRGILGIQSYLDRL